MTEKFVLVNLKGKKAKRLAESISSDTCRKILDYLSEKEEASASEISKKLKIPISTVNYNLKSLIRSKLIESKEFKWSPKGREMNLYKVAKKLIILSPGGFEGLGEKLKTIIPVIFIFAIVIGFGYLFISQPGDLEEDFSIKKFSSVQEIYNFLVNAEEIEQSHITINEGISGAQAGAAVTTGGGAVSGGVPVYAQERAIEYSTTNIQVEGVDESDFVKNDDKYIYIIKDNKVVIIDAYPPTKKVGIVSTIDLGDSRPKTMFVNKDVLVIFVEHNEGDHIFSESREIYKGQRGVVKTYALLYDISDRENPKFVRDYNVNGNYFESRMIGNHIYIIVKENVYYNTKGNIYYNEAEAVDIPVVRRLQREDIYPPEGKMNFNDIFTVNDIKDKIIPDIYYSETPDYSYTFNTIIAFDIFNGNYNAKTFMMGDSSNLYMSQNNIYITHRKKVHYDYRRTYNKEKFYKFVMPLLPYDIQNNIKKIENNKELNLVKKWYKISEVLDNYIYTKEDDQDELYNKIYQGVNKYMTSLVMEGDKTFIHKINLNKNKIEYKATGEVYGYVLNQFSMDEYDNHFRIATTTTMGNRHNNIYVLDGYLKIVGKLENLAPEEKIYSARFMSEKGYLVTFRKVDPLFVIDLSDHENPKVLGKLKIPGYSDYLHPYDETHIIGIGKDTIADTWYQGVKMALFDVSDVENPIEMDKVIIGKRGSDSEVLRDHKAFLFDKEKNLLVLPVDEVKEMKYYHNQELYATRNEMWRGAYVFKVSPSEGFELSGKITHAEFTDENYRWGTSKETIKRSLYMDDVLYTISGISVQMNEIDDIKHTINKIELK